MSEKDIKLHDQNQSPAKCKLIGHVQGSNASEWKCPTCGGLYYFADSIPNVPVCNGDGTATVPRNT